MATYSVVGDLLTGNIPTPVSVSPDKYVQDATDEIDSKLGHLFETPFVIGVSSTLSRPSQLLLKRINNHLATGRLIMAVASPEENSNLHSYGWNLVAEATAALGQIVSGDIILDGAVPLAGAGTEQASVPLLSNLDSESNVEAYYDRIANPNYRYYPHPVWTSPDRFVK